MSLWIRIGLPESTQGPVVNAWRSNSLLKLIYLPKYGHQMFLYRIQEAMNWNNIILRYRQPPRRGSYAMCLLQRKNERLVCLPDTLLSAQEESGRLKPGLATVTLSAISTTLCLVLCHVNIFKIPSQLHNVSSSLIKEKEWMGVRKMVDLGRKTS